MYSRAILAHTNRLSPGGVSLRVGDATRQPPPSPRAKKNASKPDPMTAGSRGDHQAGEQLDQVLADDQVMPLGPRVRGGAWPGGHREINHGQKAGRGQCRHRRQKSPQASRIRSRSSRTIVIQLSTSRLVQAVGPATLDWSEVGMLMFFLSQPIESRFATRVRRFALVGGATLATASRSVVPGRPEAGSTTGDRPQRCGVRPRLALFETKATADPVRSRAPAPSRGSTFAASLAFAGSSNQ